jgi:hypothetical protein
VSGISEKSAALALPWGRAGNLHSNTFDSLFLIGIPAVAFLSTLLAVMNPSLLPLIISLDVWLLGYHHVFATYTRYAADFGMSKRLWWSMTLLPFGILGALILIATFSWGAKLIGTIFVHWQLFHYIRQSEGIFKAYAFKANARSYVDRWDVRIAVYCVPVAMFLYACAHSPDLFLGLPVWLIHLPIPLATALASVATLYALKVTYTLWGDLRVQKISPQLFTFFSTHLVVFFVSYVIAGDMTMAWLCANIWHNLQYLLFVWWANNRSAATANGALSPMLNLSQNKNWFFYILICLACTFIFYQSTGFLMEPMSAAFSSNLSLTFLVFYSAVNFHHYIVDSLIWRKPKTQTAKPSASG